MRDLLTLIDLRGAEMTRDAAHCNRATAQAILHTEADLLLHLKANRDAGGLQMGETPSLASLTRVAFGLLFERGLRIRWT